MKVTGVPVALGKRMTLDFEVDAPHSYTVEIGGVPAATHNTVSLLAGATPGVHFPISRYYIRRVRMNKDMPMVAQLASAGYKVEPCQGSEKTTVVVEFPVDCGKGVRSQAEVSIWEKVRLTEFLQKYWCDNQVSVTIDFDPVTEGSQIGPVLDYAQYYLKSISFLPRFEGGAYPQMPYETITEEVYLSMASKIKSITGTLLPRLDDVEQDMFCDGDKCVMQPRA